MRDDFGWQPPQNLGGGVNTEYNDSNPEIFEDDENTGAIILYFDSNRPSGPGPYDNIDNFNGNDIYASVLQPDETFGPAELLMELSLPPAKDNRPFVGTDWNSSLYPIAREAWGSLTYGFLPVPQRLTRGRRQ